MSFDGQRHPRLTVSFHEHEMRRNSDATKTGTMQEDQKIMRTDQTSKAEIPPPLNIVTPLTLEGSYVRLEPIRRDHAALFWEIAKDSVDDIFRWYPYAMQTAEDFRRMVEKIFEEQQRGESVAFATVERKSGDVIGSTRFMNIDRANRRVEIGSTWIIPNWQRTAVNTEAKYLMLRHAFETWGCFRVELKTDALNEKSRNAILRIGAKEEGTFRRHVITWTGRVRDSVYFSVLDSEWPEVKSKLEAKLAGAVK
jgi:N-acetyltransferase